MRAIRSAALRGTFSLLLLLAGAAASEAPARAEGRLIVRREPAYDRSRARVSLEEDAIAARGVRLLATELPASAFVRVGVDRFGDGDAIVRFAQTHQGLPVIGRGASVRFSPSGAPVTTVLDLEHDLPDRSSARVPASEAAAVASTATPFSATERDAHLVVWPTLDRGARLAWVVLPRVPTELGRMPRVVVDAVTHEVLQARDLLTFAKAKVYTFNPVTTPTLATNDLAIAPEGQTLTNPFLQSSNCIDKKTVKTVNVTGFDLTVHVCDLTQTAAPNASGDYLYDPSDVAGSAEARSDTFSEVSMYYHASKAYAFFRSLQGDDTAQVVVDKPLRLIANLQIPDGIQSGDLSKAGDPNVPLAPFQNAFFAPAAGGLGALFQQLYGFEAGALWFGQGPKRDYSYDGDVIYHEFTHAVVDATLKLEAWHVDARGAIDSPGAMNEGLADYFSSAITGDPNVGEYAAADIGIPDGQPIRTLDNKDTCAGLGGEAHDDSTVFSGGLWSARMSLPEADRVKFDAALYKAMRASPGAGDLGYEDLTKLFLATLTTDLPAGATALEAKMTERGLLPACERILPYAGAPLQARDSRLGFAAPGKQSVDVKGTAPGILQVKADVPANAQSMKVSFSVHTGGGAFGGNAKPFTPVVLARLGSPITWDPKSTAGHDATLKATPTPASGNASATIDLPAGTPAGAIYVQIASIGDADGAYDQLAVEFTVPPAEGGDGDAGAPASGAAPSAASTDSGCSATHVSPSTTVLPGTLGLLAALAALALRRRRA